MKLNDKRVFLSGPMSKHRHYNVDKFAIAHDICKKAGAKTIYDPAIEYLTSGIEGNGKKHSDWLRTCLHTLTMDDTYYHKGWYDVLVQLPGWEDSEGARTEATVADACGITRIALEEVE